MKLQTEGIEERSVVVQAPFSKMRWHFFSRVLPFVLLVCYTGDDFRNRFFLYELSYGPYALQKFNLYLPENRNIESTPVIFLIHGGYWKLGSKDDYHKDIKKLSKAFPDVAFVSIGYRLYDGRSNRFPTQEEDVRACIDHVLGHSARYGISNRFIIYGTSVGAQLGALYAYKYSTSPGLQALIIVSGLTDLMAIFKETDFQVVQNTLMELGGNPFTKDSLVFQAASPIRFLHNSTVPTLIIHGKDDSIVPFSQSVNLVNELKSRHVTFEFRLFEKQNHDLGDVGREKEKIVKRFLRKYLEP